MYVLPITSTVASLSLYGRHCSSSLYRHLRLHGGTWCVSFVHLSCKHLCWNATTSKVLSNRNLIVCLWYSYTGCPLENDANSGGKHRLRWRTHLNWAARVCPDLLKCAICRTNGTLWCTCNTFYLHRATVLFATFSPHLEASFHCKCLLLTHGSQRQSTGTLRSHYTLFFKMTYSTCLQQMAQAFGYFKNEPPFL